MDSHSYSGFNASGSSFLQELTVEDPTKDVYAGSQVPQQRPYQAFQDPNSGHYSTPSNVSPGSYYNGQYNVDPYYFNHPIYPQRGKYPENYVTVPISSQPSANSQVAPRSASGQSSMSASWAESQQPPQYQSDHYTPQSTFHSSGSSSRMSVTNYPSGHMAPVGGSSTHQSYQDSAVNPYQVAPGPYCHSGMPPNAYTGLSPPPQQQQPPTHSLSINGEPMNPYAQQSRISPNTPRQQLPKTVAKRPPKPRGSGPVVKSPYSQNPMYEPAALERFVNTQCPPNVISVGPTNEVSSHSLSLPPQPQQPPLPPTSINSLQVCLSMEPPPHVSSPIESRCQTVNKPKPVSPALVEREEGPAVSQALNTSPLRVKSPQLRIPPFQPCANTSSLPPSHILPPLTSQSASSVVSSPQAAAFSPRLEQVPEGSPQPPSLKSPLPLRSPPASSSNDNLPPILPKEPSEVGEDLMEEIKPTGLCSAEQPVPSENVIPGLSKSNLEADRSPQKRLRGRKRKMEQSEGKGDADPSKLPPSITEKKRPFKATGSTGRRRGSPLPSSGAKRSRRKTVPSKAVVNYDLDANKRGIEAEDLDKSSFSEAKASMILEGDDDEDTMAASVALTEVDEESVTATTTTTTEETTEVFLKRPRPPPRLRASRPKKKKKSLKSLMKKKRRGAYHYGDESDGSDSDDDGGGCSSRAALHPVASSHSINSQLDDENSLDSSARRSGRRGTDRKKYTIDSVDFGLSDDGDGEGGDSADASDNETVEGSGRRSGADFVVVKVVEKILGHRMSTRPVKKLQKGQRCVSPKRDHPNPDMREMNPSVKKDDGKVKEAEHRMDRDQQHQEKAEVEEEEEEEEQVEEFYLKYKGFSYMHCEWKALDEIADPRIATKLKKFLAKNGTEPLPPPSADDDDGTTVLFNPDYVEVDRVLDIRIYDRVSGDIVTDDVLNPDGTIKRPQGQQRSRKKRGRPPRSRTQGEGLEDEVATTNADTPDTAESETQDEAPTLNDEQPATVTYYLVKWRSLPYEDATWELAEDVDPAKVREYMRIRNPPKNPPVIRDSNHKIIRPDPSVWRPITEDEVYRNDNRLREYQVEGVNWLSFCWYNKRNCILADEMGLGKTVQSIAFLLEVIKAGVAGPFLIIVPLSTVGNWQREFENWSDLNTIVYHGSAVSRSMIQEYELFYHRKKAAGGSVAALSVASNNLFSSQYRHDVYKFNALITTFEVLMSDIEFFGKMHWAVAIIDEAHRLKNKKCKLGEGLRYLDLDHRVLLTGTPLQNNVEELFGLLNFLEPERFACASTFLAEFGELKTEQQVEDLKTLLKPMMLRRLKEDVEKGLAPKEETIIEVELTNLQKKYYRAIMERNFTFLCKGTTASNMPNLMNVMMELRKCCNHPFLIKGAEEAILAEQRVLAEADPSKPYNEEQQMFNVMLNASGKLVLIHKLLPKLKAGGHKVLVFSQMIRVLDILEDYLVYQGFSFERIDGRIHGLLRQEAIDRFCNDPDKFVFLLCTKAGGLGINLTAADVVIIYDSDWNPQNDLQAQARCHRIGQQKMVKVYRLITRNTYEREMFDRASLKLGLDKAVLQSTGAHARQAQLSKKEVEELLKKGAYGALMDDDKAGDDFCEEDIDQILQSRSHVVQLEQGEKNSTFSKATFSISDNRNDIALDDPDFWQKWAKKAGVEEVGLEFEDLIMTTPRQRRQTHRYTAELNEQQSSSSLTHSQCASRLPNGNNGGGSNAESTDGENSSGESSCADDDGGDSRASGTTIGNIVPSSKPKHKKSKKSRRNEEGIGESIDRVDLFRVEKCLFTWSWGRWAHAIDCFPFKRVISEMEMQRIARCILGYALKVTPALTSGGDAKVRAVVMEMINSVDVNGLRTIADVVQSLKASNSEVSLRGPGGISSITSGCGFVVRRGRRAGLRIGGLGTDSPNDPSTPTTPTMLNFDMDPASTADTPKQEDHTQDVSKREEDLDQVDFGITSDSFKRHLVRAGGRLLARVYTLYFLHTEIVGLEHADGLCDGSLDHSVFTQLAESLPPLKALDADVPADWWDSCCDKCLLLGVFKHGWEKYFAIRDDPAFCFYRRVYGSNAPTIPIPSTIGTLKGVAGIKIKSEEQEEGGDSEPTMRPEETEEEDDDEKILTIATDDITAVTSRPKSEVTKAEVGEVETETQLPPPLLLFPAVVDLNSRMRKLIAYFQRVRAQVELESVHNLRSECIPSVTTQPYLEQRIIKWSRREEADFYRVVSSFGVEQVLRSPPHSPTSSRRPGGGRVFIGYNWTNFKVLANLSKKSDQAITEYYNSFLTMCHRVCNEPLPEGMPAPVCSLPTTTTYGSCPADEVIPVAPISEERATRTLSRIKLLNRIRNTILTHEHLEERLTLCQRSSDLPEWWVPGQHDRELLQAVARHGLARTDLNILPDKKFSFSRVSALVRRQLLKNPSALHGVTPPTAGTSTDTTLGGPLSVSEVEARASLAAAASVAARAVAAELEAKIDAANVPRTEGSLSFGTTRKESENQGNPVEDQSENGAFEGRTNIVTSSEPNPESPSFDTKPINNEHFRWSLQFATSLAVGWPKDRAIHNRLEMVCQCIETGHWPLPRRYILNNVEELGRYHLTDSTGGGSRDASPAPPSSPDISTQKKALTSAEAATLAALSAAGYTSIDQVLAFQAAVAANAAAAAAGGHQSDIGAGTQAAPTAVSSRGGRGGGRGSRGGRGRGRGSRGGGGAGAYSREDFASAASLAAVTKSTESPLPTRGRGSRGGQMLPPRGSPGSTRGRKRKFETTDTKTSLPPPDSSAWEVNVPLISLVNGNLIHGEKAPKRRHLEAWLEAHPDYMPYSVEPEDQVIFNRVAKARGQDTSAMEALAYRHYMSSVLSKVASYAASSSSQRPTASTSTASASELMEHQQKQLLAFVAASAYSSNPAYASLIASALGYSQAAAAAATSSAPSTQQKSSDTEKPSTSSETKSSASTASDPVTIDDQAKRSGGAEASSVPSASTSTTATSQLTPENLQSVLTAYQQAASFVAAAYMYNPSLYGQHFSSGSSSTSATATSGSTPASSSSATATGSSDAFQRQQMSNLLSSVFGSTALNSQLTTEKATEVPASSPQPPPHLTSRQETEGEERPAVDEEEAIGGAGSGGKPVIVATGEGCGSSSAGDGDVLDLSKPE
ncbi:Chromodomain-helicase-DNA-binding protein 7 [Echinococcus granulosus]|nr:Chromodomain-helicase-DNA-binding protein 7 [Echinococcus granulosus]